MLQVREVADGDLVVAGGGGEAGSGLRPCQAAAVWVRGQAHVFSLRPSPPPGVGRGTRDTALVPWLSGVEGRAVSPSCGSGPQERRKAWGQRQASP